MDIEHSQGVDFSQRISTLSITSVFFGISTISIALRFYVRIKVINQPSWDDWVIGLAWFGMAIYLCFLGILVKYGLGVRKEHFSPDWYRPALMIGVGIQAVCYFIMTAVKVSILLLYLRFVTCQTTRLLIVNSILILLVFLVICEICVFVQCRPLKAAWDRKVPGKCINFMDFLYATASFHIAADLWILFLPIPTLLKIKATGIQKIVLLGVFLIGGVATAVSCVRLYTIKIFTSSRDPIYDSTPIKTWTSVEMGLGVICACIPTLRPLFPTMRSHDVYTEDETTLNERTVNQVRSSDGSSYEGTERIEHVNFRCDSSSNQSQAASWDRSA